jgi:hypothetical protein
MPENDVGVFDGGFAISDPFGDSARGLAGGLGDVAAGGVELLVVIWDGGLVSKKYL